MSKNDLISRDALLAAYDAVHKGPPGVARKLIAEAPAVDAVPVVRCKDCIYWHGTNDGCSCLGFYPRPDWYCADGKERDDES